MKTVQPDQTASKFLSYDVRGRLGAPIGFACQKDYRDTQMATSLDNTLDCIADVGLDLVTESFAERVAIMRPFTG